MSKPSTPKFTTKEEALAAYASGGRGDVVMQARTEQQAVVAARQAHKPKPPTPAIDAVNEAHATGVNGKKSKGERTPRPPKVEAQLFVNGRPMPASQNKLSSVAYQATRGVGGDVRRISTGDLVKLLGTLGIEDATATSFDVQLPNGVLVSQRIAGDKSPVKQPAAKPAKAAATKRPAKKATAKKATAKKAAATPTSIARTQRAQGRMSQRRASKKAS